MPLNKQPSVLEKHQPNLGECKPKSWEGHVTSYFKFTLSRGGTPPSPPNRSHLAKRRLVEDGEVAGLLDEFGVEVEVVVEAAVGFRLVNLLGHEQVRGVVVALGLN